MAVIGSLRAPALRADLQKGISGVPEAMVRWWARWIGVADGGRGGGARGREWWAEKRKPEEVRRGKEAEKRV